MVGLLTQRLCGSLTTLELPLESFDLYVMSHNRWPCLHELRLTGEYSSLIPLVSILHNQPVLRVLQLKLTPLAGSNMPPIWPPRYVFTDERCPSWPELDTLTISYPHADDELFSHVPPTMRSLSLRCWPHHSTYQWTGGHHHDWINIEQRWSCSVPTSSYLLRLLKRCGPLLRLEHLEIEYRADDQDAALLSHITTAFPSLASLKIYRYRATGDIDVPVVSVQLPLTHLTITEERKN